MQAEATRSIEEYLCLRQVTQELLALLGSLRIHELQMSTRCAPMTVRGLAAHVAGSLFFARTWIDEQPQGPPTMDRVTMWRSFPDGVRDRVIVDAMARSEAIADTVADLHAEANALFERAASEPADRTVGYTGFCMSLRDMLACRVLEVAVHTLDFQAATGRVEALPEVAEPLVRTILDGLLGQKPDVQWDPTTYALCATGRRALDDDQAARLGPLADLLPVLS